MERELKLAEALQEESSFLDRLSEHTNSITYLRTGVLLEDHEDNDMLS